MCAYIAFQANKSFRRVPSNLLKLTVLTICVVTNSVTASPLERDKFWCFEELLVVGDEIYIGASPDWFPQGHARRVYSQWEGGYRYLQVGDAADTRFITADKTGRLSITSKQDRDPKGWTYYGPVHVADEGLSPVCHEGLTDAWRNENDPKEGNGVWPVYLLPDDEPTIIRDNDGVDRKVFRAVLAKRPTHQDYRFTVSRVRKEPFYPDPRLLNGRYSVRGLCVYRGEVYYGDVGVNQFPKEDWTDYWLPDTPFLVTKWDGKFRLLSVTEDGEVKLTDRATTNTYWVFYKPKSEARESSIAFRMHNFKSTRESKEIRYLVPDDKPTIVKDKEGKDVQLFRLKLGKEPKTYYIYRYAP